ncbi:FMN-dependent NADH-azoreductase [Bacillus anthracis]|nr:FMN-dependent NADH-azoreductase [Bacillus anthracis]
MSKVLFVKANDRPAEQAVSLKLYEAFLASYKEAHPNDTVVTELDLYKEEFPYVGVDIVISGGFKGGQGFDLTEEEAKAVAVADKYLNQFLEADKVVFGFPLWNFTVPAVLLTYISYLNRAGKTFKYTADGPVGLVGGKKVVLLGARGCVYSSGPVAAVEMAVNYVASVLGFLGVTNLETVVIEGHNQFPDKAEEIITAGLEEAAKVANKF